MTKGSIYKSIDEAMSEELEYIRGRMDGRIRSMKTPWPRLNKAGIDGVEWGTVNTVAAMSGVGKTAFTNQLVFSAEDCNPDDDIAMLFFTVEMSSRRLFARRISHDLNMPVKDIYDKNNKRYKEIVENIIPKYKGKDIVYVEKMYSPKTIIRLVRDFCNERLNKKCLVVYDHSLLIRREKGQTERDALIELANEFNMTKKQFPNSSYIIISQLNRSIEAPERINTLGLQYPKKSDIFGSDALYQASDIVLVIHDPFKLGIRQYGPKRYRTEGFLFGHLLKVREGKPGMFIIKNEARINKFPELTGPELIQHGFLKKGET